MKYESNNITTSSSRQYHAGILNFWSTRTVISDIYFVNVTADQPLSENSTAQWRGQGCGMGVGPGRLLSQYFWEHSNKCNEVLKLALGLSLFKFHRKSVQIPSPPGELPDYCFNFLVASIMLLRLCMYRWFIRQHIFTYYKYKSVLNTLKYGTQLV